MIRITSKRDGFRRCGVEHPPQPTLYPDGAFTPEEVARLKTEPMLVVEDVPDAGDEGRKSGGKAGKGAPKRGGDVGRTEKE